MIYKKRGVFKPKRTDNLRPEGRQYIGRELLWTYAGTMDVSEPYEGQMTFLARELDGRYADMGWVPEEDILWLEMEL